MTHSSRKQLWNACIGNFFEHYDIALFGFLSPFLAPLIFPKHDPLTALILTYAIAPIGMIARPIGSLVFGYIGSCYGRHHVLFITLTGMGVISGCMTLLPTYAQVGLLAPFLFCFARAIQQFLAGGETLGGALFVLESAPPKQHDFLSSLYSASSIGGHLLASFGVYLLSRATTIDSGWRYLYLFGSITALFGCFVRRGAHYAPTTNIPLRQVAKICWTYRKPLLLIIITSGYAAANYSIALVLMNGFIPLVSSVTKTQLMGINSYLLLFDCCTLPFFGWLASKISREKLMLCASLGVTFFAIPLSMLLEGASLTTVIAIRTCFVLSGVAFFAPFYAWAQQLIPPTYRYIVISLGYALGAHILGEPTAALSLWCYKTTGIVSSVTWIWVTLALASSLAIGIPKLAQELAFWRD